MYCIEVNEGINQITTLYYYLGLWHRGEEPTIKETMLKLFYLIYYLQFPISLLWGSYLSDNKDESIFLVEEVIVILVVSLKFFYIIGKQKKFMELFNQICVYSVDEYENFNLVNEKLQRFMKYVKVFLVVTFPAGICVVFIAPFVGTDRSLFFNIGFPLDYKHNEIAFWIAFAFILSEVALSLIMLLTPIIFWYVLIHCAVRYEVLGNQIRNMGAIRPLLVPNDVTESERKITEMEKQNIYIGDLIDAVESYNHIRDLINQLESFLAIIFLAQLATSAVCICVSIYCLIFNLGDNLIERLIYVAVLYYNIFEIFMVMYFGNEISLSSQKLAYCLFESGWLDQRQSTKKSITIFAELVKQPHVLFVGKIYPLTLETFTRILNSAYSMFNILQNLNQH